MADGFHQVVTTSRERDHGVTSRSVQTSNPSTPIAKAIDSTDPSNNAVGKRRANPKRMKYPKPPFPINGATDTSPLRVPVATRTPGSITGSASGHSPRHN